jgi:glycosyltransferase involved in cell wall biosynthesis
MAKVSIIIPTYNRAYSLRLAIISVLNQTFHDFEIIVVDDGSRDNTHEVISEFSDGRIRYICHEVNKKEAGARNTGVVNSTGEYIAFIDDDDEWLPEKLEKQIDLLENSSRIVGCVYTGFFAIEQYSGRILYEVIPQKRGNIFNDMFIDNWIGTPSTVLLKKECFDKVGFFDEKIAYGPDYDMWIRLAKEFHIEYIAQPLVKYYIHERKLSTNYKIMISGKEVIIEKYKDFFESDRKVYSNQYLSLGVLYCYNGDIRKGRQAFLNAIRIYPLAIRSYYNLCLSLLGISVFQKLKKIRDEIDTLLRSMGRQKS